MTKLATIEKIHSIQPHPNADNLDVAKIKEWPVVIKRGQFAENDLVVFIRIDSIVPESNPYFEFMRKQKFRIWNAKFRGAPSQGLVCPFSIVQQMEYRAKGKEHIDVINAEGNDVTEVLGIVKYEKPLDTSVGGDAKGGFPTHLIPITDEDNLLNFPETLKEFDREACYITVKADGSSMTVINDEGTIRVCSRRLELKEGSGLWKIVEKYGLHTKLKDSGLSIAIQAEACGGKIQGNPIGLDALSFFVFNVKDIRNGKWFNWDEIKDICNTFNINHVRPLMQNFIFDKNVMTIAKLQEIANGVTYITSKGEIRKGEGIVLRPTNPKFSATLGKMLSVKILNQDYKQ